MTDIQQLYQELLQPSNDLVADIAKLDGCSFIWLASPKEITGENGKVKTLICNKMKLGEPDSSGRRAPVETGETFSIDVDMVIKAAGQIPFEQLVTDASIENKSGKITISSKTETNLKGVFAGGDAVNGGKEVVDAVQAGKNGAKGVLEYLGLC